MKIWSSNVLINSFLGLSLATALAIGGVSQPLFASGDGECHFHGSKPAEESTVIMCSERQRQRLIKKGTIAATWATIKQSSIEQIDGKKGKEWKLTFNDPAASDKTKSTFYMFYSQNGNFIASNFTGK